MTFDQLSALAIFAFVSTFTPGPNNLMLMTSGANVGYLRTLPHLLGITFGFAAMVFLVGLGLSGLFSYYPNLYTGLKYLSVGYLCYLAWLIATSGTQKEQHDYRPLSFLAAASFQWVNPKGWTMAITATTVYNQNGSVSQLVTIATTFLLFNLPSGTTWVIAGRAITRWLKSPQRVKRFNISMAVLLVASIIPML
jgi:threonine/homoserine/homoserine lactone efflux protein